MHILEDLVQGTDAWLDVRANHPTASEAPVMMGDSPKMRRNELLDMKFTGIAREVSRYVQEKLFDKGHELEALARPIIEGIIGEDLYPVVALDDDDWLLASFDGLTMLENIVFEHKMWNESLAELVRANDLPAEYYWQLEQQLLVSGAEKAIFVTSDGTEENMAWMWYHPVPGRAERLVRGWKQFEKDLLTYTPPEAKVEVAGTAPETLMPLTFKLTGMVEASNIDAFKAHAIAKIEGINRTLVTDKHFADADLAVKWCADVEGKIKEAKQAALDQTMSIADLLKGFDEIGETARQTRLELEKLVKAQKAARIKAITESAQVTFDQHIAEINASFGGKIVLPPVAIDIASAVKGKRSLDSIKNAADTEAARAKIAASELEETITANLTTLREKAGKHGRLFADAQALVVMDNTALVALIDARIDEADKAEAERVRVAAEAAAEQARKEEQDRAEAAAAVAAAAVAPVADPVPAANPTKAAVGDFFGSAPETAANQPVRRASASKPVDTITITRAEYDTLKASALKLEALIAAGVDNWEGYDDALHMLAVA